MPWASLVTALASLLGSLVAYLTNRQLLSAGQAEAAAKQLQEQADALRRANEVRAALERDLRDNPDGLHDDDGFRRD